MNNGFETATPVTAEPYTKAQREAIHALVRAFPDADRYNYGENTATAWRRGKLIGIAAVEQ